MKQRVIDIIEHKKLTSSHFADKIGVPRSTISHILSGRNKPSLELISKIADSFPEINLDWLIKGKGSMLKSQTSLFDPVTEIKSTPEAPEKSRQDQPIQDSLQMETTEGMKNKSTSDTDKDINESKASKKETEVEKETPHAHKRKVSSIIIIYDNNTFKILNPGN